MYALCAYIDPLSTTPGRFSAHMAVRVVFGEEDLFTLLPVSHVSKRQTMAGLFPESSLAWETARGSHCDETRR